MRRARIIVSSSRHDLTGVGASLNSIGAEPQATAVALQTLTNPARADHASGVCIVWDSSRPATPSRLVLQVDSVRLAQ